MEATHEHILHMPTHVFRYHCDLHEAHQRVSLEVSERRGLVLVSCFLKAVIQQLGITMILHSYQFKVSKYQQSCRVAWDTAHLLPLAVLSLDEDHQHNRVLSRGVLCVVFFRKHFAMHPIGDQLDPSHCGRMLDCTASLANYYSHMTNLEYTSLRIGSSTLIPFEIVSSRGDRCIFTVDKFTCYL